MKVRYTLDSWHAGDVASSGHKKRPRHLPLRGRDDGGADRPRYHWGVVIPLEGPPSGIARQLFSQY